MYLPKATLKAITAAATGLRLAPSDVLLLLLAEQNLPDLEALIGALNKQKISFLGGVFPGVIHGDQQHAEGAVLIGLPAKAGPFVATNLDGDPTAIAEWNTGLGEARYARCTAIVIADGLAPNISGFLAGLFGLFGNSVNYVGGGAGFSSLKHQPCVLTPSGVLKNAAAIVFAALESTLGVRHGWKRLVGPIVATRTRKNVVSELNWKRAFDVYRGIVEEDCGKPLARNNFATIAAAYPFGILKEGAEDIVRDPFEVNDDGELVCVGEIPENAVLNILKGKSDWLVSAAGQAAEDCVAARGRKPHQGLVVDCVSRGLFLQEGFGKELKTVSSKIQALDPQLALEGMLSIGEIASPGRGFLEFFNKTIVVGVLHDA